MTVRLGDLLVQRGVLTPAQQAQVAERQRNCGRPFGQLVEQMFGINERVIEQAWAAQYAALAPRIDPRSERVDPSVLHLINRRQAWQFRLLPIRQDGTGGGGSGDGAGELMLCSTQEHLARALRFAGWKIGAMCYFVLAEPAHLGDALARYYPMDGMTPEMVSDGRLVTG